MLHRILAPVTNVFIQFRHRLFSVILEKFVFGSKGFERNIFGSVISPLEMRINWDPDLEIRALKIRSFFSEIENVDWSRLNLHRIGSTFDGGYFLPANYTQIDGVISAGIGDDNNFEYEFANLGRKVLQFDPTILTPPLDHHNMEFIPKYVNRDFNLNDCFSLYSSIFGQDLKEALLKIDIEGSEWELFTKVNESKNQLDFIPNVHTLVIEFHGMSQIYNQRKWEMIEESLQTILSHFKPIFISGNNSRPFFQMGGVPLLDVFEVTFVRRKGEFLPKVITSLNPPRNLPSRVGLMAQAFHSRTKW